MFAGSLGMVLDRPVIDKTGITSYFEIHLVFSPDDSAAPRPLTPDPGASPAVRAIRRSRDISSHAGTTRLKTCAGQGARGRVSDRPHREAFGKLSLPVG